jgi:tRNA (cytidine/uridine-2'-O-)-methyltransferase
MLHVALWEPEIPPNTGNIARSCAAVGARLHLIGRLGFHLDDRHLRRAGMDYWQSVEVRCHETLADLEAAEPEIRIVCFSSKVPTPYTRCDYRPNDCLLFGSESKGLPAELMERFAARTFTIPMPTGAVRSLNLATSVGIVLYEALRQTEDW